MRAQIFSDLQMDRQLVSSRGLPFVADDVEVVLIAGDLYPFLGRSLMTLQQLAKRKPVIYVAGNRDFYLTNIDEALSDGRQLAQELGVHFLEDEAIVIDGVRFVGSTLWSDYNVRGDAKAAKAAADRLVSDHTGEIKWSDGRRFTAADAAARHHFSRKFIEETLASSPEPVVVVTHHAPSLQSEKEEYANSPISPSFVSDLEYLMTGPKAPVLWVHGATHHPVDYVVGGTRVISNPRGYPHEAIFRFNPSLVVDIPTLSLQHSI